MIRTIEQYRITQTWLTNYEKSLCLLKKYVEVKDTCYLLKVDSLKEQIELFKKKSKEYDLAIHRKSTCAAERLSFKNNLSS